MQQAFQRIINFESVSNFRDMGGYQTFIGQTIAWRRLFRSGDLCKMTRSDFDRLIDELKIKSVLDLRGPLEIENQGMGILSKANIKHCNVSFITDGAGDPKANELRYKGFTSMGEYYIHLSAQSTFGKSLIEALDFIAEPSNHPLVFHCSAGRDRSGMLAAILLGILNVAQEDIVADYSLSILHSEILLGKQGLPGWFWKTEPKSMSLFLSKLRLEYGSIRGYAKAQGADLSLFHRLENALLI